MLISVMKMPRGFLMTSASSRTGEMAMEMMARHSVRPMTLPWSTLSSDQRTCQEQHKAQSFPAERAEFLHTLLLNIVRGTGHQDGAQGRDHSHKQGLYVYRNGIQDAKFSYAAAVGLVKSVLALLMIMFSNRASKKLGAQGLF